MFQSVQIQLDISTRSVILPSEYEQHIRTPLNINTTQKYNQILNQLIEEVLFQSAFHESKNKYELPQLQKLLEINKMQIDLTSIVNFNVVAKLNYLVLKSKQNPKNEQIEKQLTYWKNFISDNLSSVYFEIQKFGKISIEQEIVVEKSKNNMIIPIDNIIEQSSYSKSKRSKSTKNKKTDENQNVPKSKSKEKQKQNVHYLLRGAP